MARPIFRKSALDKLALPEQFDELMQVTTLRLWIILAAFGSMTLMIVIWGLWGKVTSTVDVQGVLNPLDLSTLQAVAYVRGEDLEKLRVGMSAQVLPAEDSVYLQGEVTSLSSSPTRNADVPLYEVHIRIERQVNRVYRSGENCSVSLIVDSVSPLQLLFGG